MSLQNLNLQCEYRSDQTNTLADFYVPCLSVSVEYCRAVGYFTSQGLALAGRGLASFLQNKGKMRLVASPILTEDDVLAIQQGYTAREKVVERAILREFDRDFTEIVEHRLRCLAWLIAERRLDIKLASPSELSLGNRGSIYHEKIGIFIDRVSDAVAFTGSPNETMGGLVSNFESIDVYWAWDDPHERVKRKIKNFERLWNDSTPRLRVLDFPTAARQELLRFRPPSPSYLVPEALIDEFTTNEPEMTYSYQQRAIDVPDDLELRDYQQEAIDAWFENNCRGFLEMATGSGKTITALSAVVRLVKERRHLFILVACPFQHLVEQWAQEVRRFGLQPILAFKSQQSWVDRVNEAVVDYNFGRTVCVVTTHATFTGTMMQRALSRLDGDTVFIADEVHHLGAEESRQKLHEHFNHRLGLSATPKRWFDREGTEALHTYFGETAYQLALPQAIHKGCLCPYSYFPHLVVLTDDELIEYEALTKKIAPLFSSGQDEFTTEGALGTLLRQRANLLNNAAKKLRMLRLLVEDHAQSIHHALFYCAPGQIDEVTSMLGYELSMRVDRFTAEESTVERQSLLSRFASGELQGLVAMKCLDEGVDVPNTQFAYILASSSNPREFIQRRGRILRNAPGKTKAKIHDLVTVPSLDIEAIKNSPLYSVERTIMRRELKRFHEFAQSATNKHKAIDVIWDLAKAYNLMGVFEDKDD